MAGRCVHITTVHHLRDPRIFYKEIPTLQAAGYDVRLVAKHDKNEVVEGVPVVGLPGQSSRLRRLSNLRAAYRCARALEPDVCHVHDPELLPVARRLKHTTGCRVVYDMHEVYSARGTVSGRIAHSLEQSALVWLDYVILASDACEAAVRGSKVDYVVLPNFVRRRAGGDPTARAGAGSPLRLLYAGVQGRQRGMETMIALAGKAKAEGHPWTLDLVGVYHVGPHRAADEARIRSQDLDGVVARIGWSEFVPWAAVARYLETADVGLALLRSTPAYVETIPTKFFEYAYYGLPIVCSDFPKWRAWIEREGCGLVVDPEDVTAIAAVLERLQGDSELYARLSAAAIRTGRQHTWDRVEGRLVALYDSLT